MPIQRLVAGIHHFQQQTFQPYRELFAHLAERQQPDTLFVTCSDSRIDPNLITHTDPGDLFVLRNAGNLVPAFGTPGGEAPTIEFAIRGLEVTNIVVCGHSHCGAIKGLLHPEKLSGMPTVAAWLDHAQEARRIVEREYAGRPFDELLELAIEENVLVQLEHLRTHPAVAEAIERGRMRLHGWVYEIGSGEVYVYDPVGEQFEPVADLSPLAAPLPASVTDVHSGDGRFDD